MTDADGRPIVAELGRPETPEETWARKDAARTARRQHQTAFNLVIALIAALFGFVYAGTMPLYAAIIRANFPLKMMGTVIGGTSMAGSLGMSAGPVAGGLIYDTFASYTWLYVGSWAMGLGAFLIAMTFKPFPKENPNAPAAVVAASA